ncbi:DUF1302 family protein [Pseudomonas sp. CR3202]|uniref:DUF1302 family protein n=1 Tax=Pseudomonas sp. CR3202 TaxID=3351532 RepID=UPI003BF08914
MISSIFKRVHDLELKHGDLELFVRGKYWYDFELKDGHQHLRQADRRSALEGSLPHRAMLWGLRELVYHLLSRPQSLRTPGGLAHD